MLREPDSNAVTDDLAESEWSDETIDDLQTLADEARAQARAEYVVDSDIDDTLQQPAKRRSKWVDEHACNAICLLILDDKRSSCDSCWASNRRRVLPPALYAEQIAPFLRFDAHLPNMLYVFGGRSHPEILNLVEMFDTWHGQWVPCPPMPTARAGCAAAQLPDGRLMVVGGYDEHGIVMGLLASCDIYDPVKRHWEEEGTTPPLSRARWGHGCAALNGKIYAIGGCSLQRDAQPQEAFMETLQSCEVYSPEPNDPMSGAVPSKGKWRPMAPLKVPRSGSRVVALQAAPGEKQRYLAAVGGCDDIFGRAETQPTVELFDSFEGHWFVLSRPLMHPRTTAAVAAVSSSCLLVVGGAPSLNSAESFQISMTAEEDAPDETAVEDIPNMSEGRMGCQAAMLSLPSSSTGYPLSNTPCVAIIGGERCNEGGDDWVRSKQYASIPVFDMSLGIWRQDVIPPMATERTAVAICIGSGYVAGL